jgi:type I restriction enzyme M protein
MSYEEFKRRIDTARNILVGAVPSPAGQIDQITYALMYKFMNDIDDKAVSIAGGKRKFFVGDYEKYNWHALMSTSLGAHERLELYRQAIQNMAKNENLPELFRSIYQNAFLPFNSADVLTMFLREMDKFSQADSDDIGDAYEYLLSITGAQGDVGQFRTPRHIIKFIVDAVNPGKDDSVLDPACGTAGFLIAAYLHVVHQHDGKDAQGNNNDESRMTADELAKLHKNYRGFDIDPTMVRTAKVNLYLHDFKTPEIINHDSLSSEDYWNEKYDVILANPPFMTPKGGIVPHKKFGISANRAEVLFVDYIASHLKPTGRAGIIVPEGVIFQSGKAYKELRKNLVENYLYAVVSLPSGVFNPYAGVKTSVLLLDKELAKNRKEILFAKIENDGYSLGAQRRKLEGDQMPEVLQLIERFKSGETPESKLAHAVPREQIADSGDYNLSGDRYKSVKLNVSIRWPEVRVGDIATLMTGGTPSRTVNEYWENGNIPWLVSGDIHKGVITDCDGRITQKALEESNARMLPDRSVMIALNGQGKTRATVAMLKAEGFTCNQSLVAIRPDESIILTEFLYYQLKYKYQEIRNINGEGQRGGLNMPIIRNIIVAQPPIEVQRDIVAELDGYQKIIDAAQTIVKTYKPTIKINPEWEITKLESISNLVQRGKSPKYGESDIQVIKSGQARGYYEFDFTKKYTTVPDFSLDHRQLQDGDLLINSTGVGTAGRVTLFKETKKHPFLADSHITILRLNKTKAQPDFVLYSLAGIYGFDGIEKMATGSGGQIELGLATIKNLEIPLPAIEEQEKIVAELEAETKLIESNKKLIEIYTQKIKSKIAEVWGE